MPSHIDTGDPKYRQAAAEILRRHDNGEPEANITSAVRGFLTVTGLVKDEEIDEENPPAEGSRRAVDLTALDTFIEFDAWADRTPVAGVKDRETGKVSADVVMPSVANQTTHLGRA